MNRLLLNAALAVCPREFRENYREEIGRHADWHGGGAGAAFDVARSGLRERLESLARAIALATRSLLRAPLFATVALTTLALAVSVNAAVFGAIDAVLLRPLPFVEPERLAMVCAVLGGNQQCSGQLTNATIDTVARAATTLDRVAAYQYASATLTGYGRPQAVNLAWTTAGYFDVVGIRPELGRFFTPSDARPGKRNVVISHELWQHLFAGVPDVVGKTLVLSGAPWTVIGVAPPFVMPEIGSDLEKNFAQLWMPLAGASPQLHNWAIARLKRGVTPQAARADLARVAAALAARDPVNNKDLTLTAVNVGDWYFRRVRPLLAVALAAVFAVLAIACANVANLLLVRGIARTAELAMRDALGASRGRIAAGLFAEIGVLAAAAGVTGLALAAAELKLLAALRPAALPRIDGVGLDWRVAAWTALAVVAAAAVAGVAPVFFIARKNLAAAVKGGARGGETRRAGALRGALAVTEIALAFAVVACSALLIRNVVAATQLPLGFSPAGVYRGAVGVGRRYAGDAGAAQFARAVVARLAAIPGVEAAAMARYMAFSRNGTDVGDGFRLAGRGYAPGTVPPANVAQVTPEYFRALGIRLDRGRTFSAADRRGAALVAVIDERIANRYLRGREPVGTRIVAPDGRNATVVGVVASTVQRIGDDTPVLYVPFDQFPSAYPEAIVKTRGAPSNLRAAVEDAVAAVDPQTALVYFDPLAAYIAQLNAPALANAALLGVLALVALLLAVAGIYAVVAYSVERRTHEFGVRKAIGARNAHVARDVLGGALVYSAFGIGIGAALAVVLAPAMQRVLVAVSAVDPATFACVTLLLVTCTVVAALVPALRAIRIEPAAALRYE